MKVDIITRSKLYALAWTLAWALSFLALIAISIRMSGGQLIYSLDDPYIHLSVANRILHGGYGINAGEFSSPSSSIIYPILLVPTVALGLGALGPIIINTLVAGLSVWLLLEFFWRHAVGGAAGSTVFAHLLCPILILAINAYGLPMTGMEHSLHVLAVIGTLLGLIAMFESGKVSVWLIAAIIFMPFFRFEGIALSGAAILALAVSGRWRAAALSSFVIFTGFAVYFVVMQRLGLSFLPSSVLVKSNVAASAQGGGGLSAIIHSLRLNFGASLRDRWGLMFAFAICILISMVQDGQGRWRSPRSPEFLLGATIILGLGAHLIAGKYEWFHRYEVYAVAILVVGGIYFLGPALFRLRYRHNLGFQFGLLAALAVFVAPYTEAMVFTPAGSRSIYEQMFQMHRFATEFFPRRVAVNDLGWVSFGNDNFVLDLWGLGSEPVRKLRAAGEFDAAHIADITKKYDVDFAMIYGEWFAGSIPDSWCLMAVLQTKHVTPAHGDVLFYATKASAREDMSKALDRFAPTLPARVGFKRESCARSP